MVLRPAKWIVSWFSRARTKRMPKAAAKIEQMESAVPQVPLKPKPSSSVRETSPPQDANDSSVSENRSIHSASSLAVKRELVENDQEYLQPAKKPRVLHSGPNSSTSDSASAISIERQTDFSSSPRVVATRFPELHIPRINVDSHIAPPSAFERAAENRCIPDTRLLYTPVGPQHEAESVFMSDVEATSLRSLNQHDFLLANERLSNSAYHRNPLETRAANHFVLPQSRPPLYAEQTFPPVLRTDVQNEAFVLDLRCCCSLTICSAAPTLDPLLRQILAPL